MRAWQGENDNVLLMRRRAHCQGAVLPVGGVLLGESIIEPLSGKMVRVGGASVRPGQLFPNAGGHQALLDSKVLKGIDNFDQVSLK